MADYSVNATTLSAPQGAGAQVISPVQQKAVNTSIIDNPIISGAIDIFATGVAASAKADAKARKDAVIKGYVEETTAINSAVSSNQMAPSTAAARSRAVFSKYAAGYSEYIEDLQKAGQALKGFSEQATIQEGIEGEKKIREADVSQAQNLGYIFTPDMTKEQQDAQIRAAKASIQAQNQFDQNVKRNQEARAAGTYDQATADRQFKIESTKLVNEVVGTQFDSFGALGNSLATSVKNGTMDTAMATAQLTERFSKINAAIQSAASVNPELAAPYRSLFNDMNETYKKLLQPGAVSADLEDQLKILQTKAKLAALSDTKTLAAVTTSNLFGNNPALDLRVSNVAIDTIARLSKIVPGNTADYSPQVVGNPDVEKDALTLLKGYSGQIDDPKIKNKEGFKTDLGNNINQVLKQTGQFIDAGATPQKLAGLADFFASPEYAKIATSGLMDRQAAEAAMKTFQLRYEPAVINGVQDKLSGFLYGQSPTVTGKQSEPKTVADSIDIKFTGAGVVFEPKAKRDLDPVEFKSQQDAVRDLQTSQKAINQLIHIGAHMAGTTDYGKYWEDNKHIFMPSVYSKYSNLNIGDIKNGMRYKGGDAKSQNSWEKVNGGGE